MATLRQPDGPGQLALEFGHEPSHAEADFIVAPGNRMALEHVRAWPNWSGPLTLIVGPPASGKSHLARIWAERSGATAPIAGAIEPVARRGGNAPLVLEDIDRAAYDELGLFHLLNQAIRDQRPLLMTAREAVGAWPYRTDDVLSRARLAANFSLAALDDMQLSQMLVKLFGDRQIAVEPRIVAYLAARMERSHAEAVAIVEALDRLAFSRGTAITRAIAAQALAQRGARRDDAAKAWEAPDE